MRMIVMFNIMQSKEYQRAYYLKRRELFTAKRRQRYHLKEKYGIHSVRKKGKSTRHHILKRYNLTEDDYARMLAEQKGVCHICSKPPNGRVLCVDHCHKSGKVRALLCSRCNLIVGLIETGLIEGCMRYLRKFD